MYQHPLIFFLSVWGGWAGRKQQGVVHPSSWTAQGPRCPLQAYLSCSGPVNVHNIFSPDPWLTLMGSFILMLIGGHGEGGSPPHFFWSNLPPLKPSTIGWRRVWSLEWIQMDGMDPCQWFEWVLAISFSSSPFHLGRWSSLSWRLLKPGWKCPGASSSAKKLPWKGSPNWSRHWNITVHHTSSHRQIFVVFCLAHQLLHWVKCVPTMVWVTSYFSR